LAVLPIQPELAYIVRLSMDRISARMQRFADPERRLNIAGRMMPPGVMNEA
jgi:hypothetical protein